MKLQTMILLTTLWLVAPAFGEPRAVGVSKIGKVTLGESKRDRQTCRLVPFPVSQSSKIVLPLMGGTDRDILKQEGAANPLAIVESPPTFFDTMTSFTTIQSSW